MELLKTLLHRVFVDEPDNCGQEESGSLRSEEIDFLSSAGMFLGIVFAIALVANWSDDGKWIQSLLPTTNTRDVSPCEFIRQQ